MARTKLTQKEKRIERFLLEAGFRPELSGFEILRECIYIASSDKSKYRKNILTVLLEEVNEKLGKTTSVKTIQMSLKRLADSCKTNKYNKLGPKGLIFALLAEMGY